MCTCVCLLLTERTEVSSELLLPDKKSRKGPINLRFSVLMKRRVKEKESGKAGLGGGTGMGWEKDGCFFFFLEIVNNVIVDLISKF